MDYQVILYHKQATSARTRFVRFAGETVFANGLINELAQIDDNNERKTLVHPTAVLRQTEDKLGLAKETLSAETGYRYSIEVPGGSIPVVLASINTTDPPFEKVRQAGGQFIDLTQARGLPALELELLRHAYELLLGG